MRRLQIEPLEDRRLLTVGTELIETLLPDSTTPQPLVGEGASVATSAKYHVAGKPLADLSGVADSGAAEVYSAVDGAHLFTIANPTPTTSDRFGHEVAVSGERVVISKSTEFGGDGVYVFELSSGTPELIEVIESPAPGRFGISVDLHGDTLVIGSDTEARHQQQRTGVVRVYSLSDGRAQFIGRVVYPNPGAGSGQLFGSAVALADEATLIVGANGDDYRGARDAGGVYIYRLGGGPRLIGEIYSPSPGAGERFGRALDASGNHLVIGESADGTDGSHTGRAYLYDLSPLADVQNISHNPPSPAPRLVDTIVNPTPVDGELFGSSVAVSGDLAVVGAIRGTVGTERTGTAHIYELNSSGVRFVDTVSSHTPATTREFGRDVAAFGNSILVGAAMDSNLSSPGSSYVYLVADDGAELTTMLGQPTLASGDRFGTTIVASDDYLVVGATSSDSDALDAGSVYVYELTSGSPQLVLTISNPEPEFEDRFGESLALSGDLLAVGVPFDEGVNGLVDTGSVYVYDLAANARLIHSIHNPAPGFISRYWFGRSVAIEGELLVVGAPRDDATADAAGAVYIYDLSADEARLVERLDNPTPELLDLFGSEVAMSGNRLVVGAPRDSTAGLLAGAVYIYDLGGDSPELTHTILNPDPPPRNDERRFGVAEPRFGHAIDVAGDTVVVGSIGSHPLFAVPLETGFADFQAVPGKVHVFDISGETAHQTAAIESQVSIAAGDSFALALHDERLAVGEFSDDAMGTNAGAARLYELDAGQARLIGSLEMSPQPEDRFGLAVAISSDAVFAGAPFDDFGNFDQGAVFVFGIVEERDSEILPGDINNDGTVDVSDFLVLSRNFGRSNGVTLADGDLNEDGEIDVRDFLILSENFGKKQ